MQLRVTSVMLAKRLSGFEVISQPRLFRSTFINELEELDGCFTKYDQQCPYWTEEIVVVPDKNSLVFVMQGR